MNYVEVVKLRVARAQLATALDLFIRDRDPVPVQCLACGGGDVVEALANLSGIAPFSSIVFEENPDLDVPKWRGIRNQYWNAFKHLRDRKGFLREDEELLKNFDDTHN